MTFPTPSAAKSIAAREADSAGTYRLGAPELSHGARRHPRHRRKTDNPRFITRAQRNLRRRNPSPAKRKDRRIVPKPAASWPSLTSESPTHGTTSNTKFLAGWWAKTKPSASSRCRSRTCRRTAALRKRSGMWAGTACAPRPLTRQSRQASISLYWTSGRPRRRRAIVAGSRPPKCPQLDVLELRYRARSRHQCGLHGEALDHLETTGGRSACPCLWRLA
jgi:hypothetical protein